LVFAIIAPVINTYEKRVGRKIRVALRMTARMVSTMSRKATYAVFFHLKSHVSEQELQQWLSLSVAISAAAKVRLIRLYAIQCCGLIQLG